MPSRCNAAIQTRSSLVFAFRGSRMHILLARAVDQTRHHKMESSISADAPHHCCSYCEIAARGHNQCRGSRRVCIRRYRCGDGHLGLRHVDCIVSVSPGRVESVIVVVVVVQANLINVPCCWSAMLGCAQWVNRLLFGLVLSSHASHTSWDSMR